MPHDPVLSSLLFAFLASIFVFLFCSIGYDLYAYVRYGTKYTISHYVSNQAKEYPLIGVVFGIIVGVLAMHFFG